MTLSKALNIIYEIIVEITASTIGQMVLNTGFAILALGGITKLMKEVIR